MKSTVRTIGNSKGIIIPKNFLKQCFIENEVNIEVQDNQIVISPSSVDKRKGWADAFQEMAKNGDDSLLIPAVFNDENTTDWQW